jgi:hypothetical protein
VRCETFKQIAIFSFLLEERSRNAYREQTFECFIYWRVLIPPPPPSMPTVIKKVKVMKLTDDAKTAVESSLCFIKSSGR